MGIFKQIAKFKGIFLYFTQKNYTARPLTCLITCVLLCVKKKIVGSWFQENHKVNSLCTSIFYTTVIFQCVILRHKSIESCFIIEKYDLNKMPEKHSTTGIWVYRQKKTQCEATEVKSSVNIVQKDSPEKEDIQQVMIVEVQKWNTNALGASGVNSY